MTYNGKLILCGIFLFSALPVRATSDAAEFTTRTVIINAPVPDAWKALQAERTSDPEHRRVISKAGSDYVVEETLDKMPVIGKAICVYSEHETAGKKIDYKLISSDKLIAFEGSWQLSPYGTGKQTLVTLSSFADTGLHMPFAAKITRERTEKAVEKRLAEMQNRVRALGLANCVAEAKTGV